MRKISLKEHERYLKKNIFQTENKWPHFNLLFNDLKKFTKKLKKGSNIVSLERNNLYGGYSLFAPFFEKHHFVSIDCITPTLKKRGAYNLKLINKTKGIIKSKRNFQFEFNKIKVEKNSADLIIIPNLMHHINDVDSIFSQSKKILKKKGIIYIFEPLVRELHQIPEDFYRITPYGFKHLLTKQNFKNFKVKFDGGPFTAITYCWDQALQYLPVKERKFKSDWLKKNFNKFLKLDKKYRKNLIRKKSSFPMSFSITGNL